MIDLKDLNTLLEAANRDIQELGRKTNDMRKDIKDIQNAEWIQVYNAWEEMARVISINKMDGNINVPIVVYGEDEDEVIITGKPYITCDESIELKIERDGIFVKWLYLYKDYQKTVDMARMQLLQTIVKDMKEHWDELEQDIEYNFKELITAEMAKRVRDAEEKAERTAAELKAVISNTKEVE